MTRNKDIIFGNMNSRFMYPFANSKYGEPLWSVSVRKIWGAKNGDLVITPRKIPQDFLAYALEILGLQPTSVYCLSPEMQPQDLLAEAVLKDKEIVQQLSRLSGSAQLSVFALDTVTVEFAQHLGIPIKHYETSPTADVQNLIVRLNTKSHFRERASALNIPVAEGVNILDTKNLEQVNIPEWKSCFKKLDTSSNGFGNEFLHDCSHTSLLEGVSAFWNKFPGEEQSIVVEEGLDIHSQPSLEVMVLEEEIEELYYCEQICPSNSFAGMRKIPFESLQGDLIFSEIQKFTRRFSEHVQAAGYRGVLDVDFAVTKSGELFASETNMRRTGGTYLHELVTRLTGHCNSWWHADTEVIKSSIMFRNAVTLLLNSGLGFTSERKTGVILTSDTFSQDHKFRYVAIADSLAELDGMLQELRTFIQNELA